MAKKPNPKDACTLYVLDNFKNIGDLRAWARAQPEYRAVAARVLNSDYCLKQHEEAINALTIDDFVAFNHDDYREGKITKFLYPKLMAELESQFDDEIIKIGLHNAIKKPVIKYNDRGLGNFIFDRASSGMFFRTEFYSPSLDKVVEGEYVEKISEDPDEYVLIEDQSEIIRRNIILESGLPSVSSNNKKVFATFETREKQNVSVEIFISCGNYAGISGSDFMYSGIEGIMIAKLLMKGGIKVKINIAVGWTDIEGGNYCAAMVPVKNYNETLDRNLLCLIASDLRFWRTEGYAICMLLRSHFGFNPYGFGLTGQQLTDTLEYNDYPPGVNFKFGYGRVQSRHDAVAHIRTAITEIAAYIDSQSQKVIP